MRLNLAAALAILALASPAVAQQSRPGTITISGSGAVELKPDFATIVVLVQTEADTVPKVVAANKAASDEALGRLQALGIKKDDVSTRSFQVALTPPRVDKAGNETKVPRFTAMHRLQIKIADVESVGRVAGEVLSGSTMLFQSVSFGLNRQDEGGDEARRAAVQDARRQASVFAAAAGVTLGRLLEIRDGSARGDSDVSPALAMRAKAADSAEAPIVPPASVRYMADVTMVWEIAPGAP